jgi:hypothetical protein
MTMRTTTSTPSAHATAPNPHAETERMAAVMTTRADMEAVARRMSPLKMTTA